jgi:hypothetical protein
LPVEVGEDAPVADKYARVANADGSYTEVTRAGHTVTNFYLKGNPATSPYPLLHREDGPAQIIIDPDGTRHEWWYERGRHHRDGGPAVTKTRPDGGHSETYYVGGELHREDGPAMTVVDADGRIAEEYYERGRQHREGAPAVIITYPDGKHTHYWYRHGRQLSSHRLLRALAGVSS